MAAFGMYMAQSEPDDDRSEIWSVESSTDNISSKDVPWIDPMSSPSAKGDPFSSPGSRKDPNPTYAAFSPTSTLKPSPISKERATIVLHQKSPLLVATPPQITRALAYSHSFIANINKVAGLLSWTTDDPWESFLLLAGFWFVTLYGDLAVRWVGPLLGVAALILGLYARRFSWLSSTSLSGEKGAKSQKLSDSETMRQHQSLDEIVDNLKLFTSRCNILLDPLLRMTEFLSTQSTATSATTKPALVAVLFRIMLVTPVWTLLTLPPFYIITTKRVILSVGTIVLTWHSRPARVCRIILWRSRTVRRVSAIITGLDLTAAGTETEVAATVKRPELAPRKPKTPHEIAASLASKRRTDPTAGIRFTFAIFENQRRWLGIGWTSSMLAYERSAWTDEHNNTSVPYGNFTLPKVEGGVAEWRWVEGSRWHLEVETNGSTGKKIEDEDEAGWFYYDNKWRDPRRGQDGWGRYTRRRKWLREAELVEIVPKDQQSDPVTPRPRAYSTRKDLSAAAAALSETHLPIVEPIELPATSGLATSTSVSSVRDDSTAVDSTASSMSKQRKPWFRRGSSNTHRSDKSANAPSVSGMSGTSGDSGRSREEEDAELHSPFIRQRVSEDTWSVHDDTKMNLG